MGSNYYNQNPGLIITLLTYYLVLISTVKAQMNVPCTSSMISTFTPCMNYITGSTPNGSAPTSNCCAALKSVMRSSMDCACLMVTASVPLPLIVNRTLALGLPRVCKAAGVPVKCEALSSPLPSPGPVQFGAPPAAPPTSSALSPQGTVQSGEAPVAAIPPPSSAFSPQASKAMSITPASDLPPVAAPSSVEAEAPSKTPKIRPVLTPSAPSASMIHSPTTIWTIYLMGLYMLFKF